MRHFSRRSDPEPSTVTPLQGLGLALRHLRRLQGLTQQEVAERARITVPMLSGYENSKHDPGIATLDRILMALDADTRDLSRAIASIQRGEEAPGRKHPSGERLVREVLAKLVDTGLITEQALPRILSSD